MKAEREKPQANKLEAFRLPVWLAEQARRKAKAQDITFSQFMRRAVRRELGLALETESTR